MRNGLRYLRHWLPWLWALTFSLSAAAVPVIEVDQAFESIDLVTAVDILADPSGRLAIADVTGPGFSSAFQPSKTDTFQSTDDSVYWLRFGVHNPGHDARSLTLTYRLQRPTTLTVFGGDLKPLPQAATGRVQLLLPGQSKQLYYLRVDRGGLALAQMELHGLDHYLKSFRSQTWFDGVRQGGLSIISVFALLMAALRRDPIYLWLAAHTLLFQLFQLFFHADFNALLFDVSERWSYLQPAPQTCLLLSSICNVRLALLLPVATGARLRLVLHLSVAASLLAIPLLYVAPAIDAGAFVLFLCMINIVATIGTALYTALATQQRYLLCFALLRLIMLLVAVGGSLSWRSDSGSKAQVIALLPFATMVESLGLLGLLLWRSFQRDRLRIRSDREIAVLEAEGRSRTEITAEVGHRIRTPVSGVIGMLDMLQDTPLSAAQLDYLNTIRRAGNELLNVVDDMSDVSRLHAQSSTLQQTVFDPQALVAECIDGFRSLATAHQLELINDPAPALPAYVSGDPTRLRQIVLHLLHQSVSQHTRGEILVRMQPLPQRHWLRFQIETHAGNTDLAPSGIDRRINPPGSANMRLAIARQLTEQLGGRLQVRADAADTLEVWFELPLPPTGRGAAVDEPDSALHGKHLLVVDDSPTFCEVLRRQAGHWGMTVHTATSASEGLARLRNQIMLGQPIDVLLVDADMPEIAQTDWLQRLHNSIQPQPVLILLSSQPERNSTPLQQLGVRRVLLKPINHTSLKITLAEEFKNHAQPALAAPQLRQEPIRCLFAEDNIINAKVLSGMLGKLGVAFTAVVNGQEAVEACQRERFDIVLMDCDMPVMDGWEASRRIREIQRNRGLASIPIIALTANTLEELGERARQPVMDAHLVKPIHLQELRALLERWTGKAVAAPARDPN